MARRIQTTPRWLLCVPAVLATLLGAGVPAPASAAAPPSSAARSAGRLAGRRRPAATRNGAAPPIAPRRFKALTLDRGALAGVLDDAPRERTAAARTTR